jgi:hypothetical protein
VIRSSFPAFCAAAALVLLGQGCTDPVDKAAKQRIFSPEDPPKVVASAAEELPAKDAGKDPRISRRILRMSAAETTERLGAHLYTADVAFEWTGPKGGVKLDEKRTLVSGAGGVSGDFHGVVENSRRQGLEVMRVEGKVYARNRFGKFRQRLRDRGMAERMREEIHGALEDFDSLFDGRLVLSPAGSVSHHGRTAWKYEVTLGPERQDSAGRADEKLPPLKFAKHGPDETTSRRLRFFEQRRPQSITGQVVVDADTAVVLKATLDGRMTAPGEESDPVSLRLRMDAEVSEIGRASRIKAPENFLPDADKPQGIADALDRFGIPRGKDGLSEAGAGRADQAPEPADDDS